MSVKRYKKHPNFMGKYLVLNANGGDRRVEDYDVLQGQQWARFVGMGFLVPFEDEEVTEAKAHRDPDPKVDTSDDPDVTPLTEGFTKEELYSVAQQVELDGRSSLDETELALALSKKLGSVEEVASQAEALKEAAKREEEAEAKDNSTKSPAGKAAKQQDKSKAGKTSTKADADKKADDDKSKADDKKSSKDK
jgi:hypothetical protein